MQRPRFRRTALRPGRSNRSETAPVPAPREVFTASETVCDRDRSDEQIDAERGKSAAREPRGKAPVEAGERNREPAACGMQKRGCDDEPCRIGAEQGLPRHLRAVRDAVRDAEAGDHEPAGRDGRSPAEGDRDAEGKQARGDERLDPGQRQARPAEGCARHHRGDEGGGPQPAPRPTDEPGPEADRDHRGQVVDTADRVHQPGPEADVALPRMRERRQGEQRGGNRCREAFHPHPSRPRLRRPIRPPSRSSARQPPRPRRRGCR